MSLRALSSDTGRRMRTRIAFSTMAIGLALLWTLNTAKAGSGQIAESGECASTAAAIERFWRIFHSNDYGAISDLQAEIRTALERDPDNVTLTALLGATHFWHVGEYTRDPKPNLTLRQHDLAAAVQLLQKALDLDYGPHPAGYQYNDHIPGLLGVTTGRAQCRSSRQRELQESARVALAGARRLHRRKRRSHKSRHQCLSSPADGGWAQEYLLFAKQHGSA